MTGPCRPSMSNDQSVKWSNDRTSVQSLELKQDLEEEKLYNWKDRAARERTDQLVEEEEEMRLDLERLSFEEREMLLADKFISILPHLPYFRHHLISKRQRLDGHQIVVDDVPDVNLVKDTIETLESVIDKLKSDLKQMDAAHSQSPAALSEWCQEFKKTNMKVFKKWMKPPSPTVEDAEDGKSGPLLQSEYRKYGRQMLMPEIGLHGQIKLRDSTVLIVGLGGLGCPAATYLARAGVATLGLVDGDTVEASNLHRQTLYLEEDIGQSKALAANRRLRQMNSQIHYELYNYRLKPENAPKLFSRYDIILDCTDRQASRYFISDAAVVAGKPLVFAAALGTVGQLMVLNNPPSFVHGNTYPGPCYRCIFPKPMSPKNSSSCGDAGVLGPVVGVMGTLMAMEAMKVLTQRSSMPLFMIYDANGKEPFRMPNFNRKNPNCASCSEKLTITKTLIESGSLDYDKFCGGRINYDVLENCQRIPARDCKRLMDAAPQKNVLVDVRDKVQFLIGHINGSINLPMSMINQRPEAAWHDLERMLNLKKELGPQPVLYFICRYGNDSQLAYRRILDTQGGRSFSIGKDIIGGYDAWRREIDPSLPDY